MKRYRYLLKTDIYDSLNKLRDAFLAAHDGNEVNEIITGLLTSEERIKIGRRILIADCLNTGMSHEEIAEFLKVGIATVTSVNNRLSYSPKWYELISARHKKVQKEYDKKKYRKIGGSELVFKKKEYTGFTRRDVER